MELQRIKMTVAGFWVLIAVAIAMAIDVSWAGGIAFAAFALLPPLAMLLLWNDPGQTMTERIREAQR